MSIKLLRVEIPVSPLPAQVPRIPRGKTSYIKATAWACAFRPDDFPFSIHRSVYPAPLHLHILNCPSEEVHKNINVHKYPFRC
ncbi:hypothetical protein DsansV1_C19g0161041 [Dioscorea sansibarensis]